MTRTYKTFKGFDKDLKCRGFQYEIGRTYEEPEARVCSCGFHACEQPIEVFKYYPPGSSRYCEVEQSGEISREGSDSKMASSCIKIRTEIDVPGLARAQVEYVQARTTAEHTDPKAATAGEYGAATAGEYGAATAGNRGAATAGDCGAATAGNRGAATAGYAGAATAGEYGAATAGYAGAATAGYAGAATAGNRGAATAGNRGAATAGYAGAATAGNRGAATAGDCGAATAGDCGAATAGYAGAATSRGSSTSGEDGLSVARGKGVRVKGGLGALLVIAEENNNDHKIKDWVAVVVDGKTIKPDTWYHLIDGEIKEVPGNE